MRLQRCHARPHHFLHQGCMVQQVQPGGRVVGLQQGLQGLNGVQGRAFGIG